MPRRDSHLGSRPHVMSSPEIFSDIHGTDHTITAYNAHSSKACPLFFLLEMVMVRVYKYIWASYFRLASLMITFGITLMRDFSWSSPCIIKLKMKYPKRTTKVVQWSPSLDPPSFHAFITISLVKCMVPLCDHVSYCHWNVILFSKSILLSLFSGRQKGTFSIYIFKVKLLILHYKVHCFKNVFRNSHASVH